MCFINISVSVVFFWIVIWIIKVCNDFNNMIDGVNGLYELVIFNEVFFYKFMI